MRGWHSAAFCLPTYDIASLGKRLLAPDFICYTRTHRFSRRGNQYETFGLGYPKHERFDLEL